MSFITDVTMFQRRFRYILRAQFIAALVALHLLVASCAQGPTFVPVDQRRVIDRSLVEYPGGVVLKELVRNLTGPIDCEIDAQGNLIIAESGEGGFDPRIYGYHRDGSFFTIYPAGRTIPFDLGPLNVVTTGFKMYGPVGGIALDNGKIYVGHRDADGFGVITAFGYDGSHTTVVAGLPCQGDFAIGDLAVAENGRLWFSVGAATNSGVVGLDNWRWAKKNDEFCDRSWVDLKLNGFHFKEKNPGAGIFGPPDVAVTGPFQPFNVAAQTRIRKQDRPTAAIYSVDPNGGNVRVEAHGIRYPRGLAFNEFGNLYLTNDGMELRGTRPVKDDPDVLLKFAPRAWIGWPDYSADLRPITDEKFQPPPETIVKSSYSELSFVIDHNASNNGEGLIPPSYARSTLLQASFPSLSGAAKFDFVPANGPLSQQFRGNAVIALGGDRAPFATGGYKQFTGPVGFKVVRVDLNSREVEDFIRNTRGKPASLLPEGQGVLERPVAVKFSPDGSTMYIVDFGRAEWRVNGSVKVKARTGKIFVLERLPAAATQPARKAAADVEPSTAPSR